MLKLLDNGYEILSEDPVRPHLQDFKQSPNNENYAWEVDGETQAVICVSYSDLIPTSENDLREHSGPVEQKQVAVFYTVWSYSKGAGAKLVLELFDHLKQSKPHLKRFVTLSPLTEMARRFHIKNGAKFINKHALAQNFEYE